jgi:hypothetical protein
VVAVERCGDSGFVTVTGRTGGEDGPPRWRNEERGGGGAEEGRRSGSGSGEGKRIGNHKLDYSCRTRPAVVERGIARANTVVRWTAASSGQSKSRADPNGKRC